jgi:hypothetical protein
MEMPRYENARTTGGVAPQSFGERLQIDPP